MKANPILHSGVYLASAAMCFLVAQSVLATTPAPTGFIDASTYGGGYNTTDATAALQAAINTGKNVFVPKESSDWFVTPITLAKNNQEILFESGVTVTAKPGAFTGTGDCLFNVTGSGVSMVGPGATLKMQQADYTRSSYTPSESRHAINLTGVTNCTIDGLNILNTGGDGVIVNAGNGNTYSQNVTIENCYHQQRLSQRPQRDQRQEPAGRQLYDCEHGRHRPEGRNRLRTRQQQRGAPKLRRPQYDYRHKRPQRD